MNHDNLSRIVLTMWVTDTAKIVPSKRARRGIDRIEVVVVIVVCAVVLGLLMPAIQAVREKSRRATCVNNLKEIGLALHNYHDARKYFPGSAEVVKADRERLIGGWSFLFKIIPEHEYNPAYDTLNPVDIKNTTPPPGVEGALTIPLTSMGTASVNGGPGLNAIRDLRDTIISEYLCPSNSNPHFENPNGGEKTGTRHAVTNYKAMCSAFTAGFMPTDQYLTGPK